MPRIFDNIELELLPALRAALAVATRADFCVGYFHLRGWDSLADLIERFEGVDPSCCRVLVGMHRPPEQVMRQAQRAIQREEHLDGPTVARLRRESAQQFREQIEFGVPSAAAQASLRRLGTQLPAQSALFRPLRESASEALGRQLRLGIGLADLADMVIRVHEEGKLSAVTETVEHPEPQVVCSLGVIVPGPNNANR